MARTLDNLRLIALAAIIACTGLARAQNAATHQGSTADAAPPKSAAVISATGSAPRPADVAASAALLVLEQEGEVEHLSRQWRFAIAGLLGIAGFCVLVGVVRGVFG